MSGSNPKRRKVDKPADQSSHILTRRLQNDIRQCVVEDLDGIYVLANDQDISIFHAIIEGPAGTPYHGGFFYFFIQMPPQYPFQPPKVTSMTTGGGSVRFNPNLYSNGKVCLSILNTWPGPSWAPAMTLRTALLSIQSLLCADPFYNEPGYEAGKGTASYERQSKEYSKNILFQTMRVAVIDMVKGNSPDAKNLPDVLKRKIRNRFLANAKVYADILQKNDHCSSLVIAYTNLKTELEATAAAPRASTSTDVSDNTETPVIDLTDAI